MRHGIAEDLRDSDFDRRLTGEGRKEVERVLRRIVGWAPRCIVHSPLVRTTQTAAVASSVFPHVPVLPSDAVAYGNMELLARTLAGMDDPLVIGHEPTMGRWCARLLGAPAGTMPFERAGFALLDVDRIPTTRPARLVWFGSPAFQG
jgi:phosphohistidine phosphatase SixA